MARKRKDPDYRPDKEFLGTDNKLDKNIPMMSSPELQKDNKHWAES
jgi:hypothetical protein